jgi:hypothetical protein
MDEMVSGEPTLPTTDLQRQYRRVWIKSDRAERAFVFLRNEMSEEIANLEKTLPRASQ